MPDIDHPDWEQGWAERLRTAARELGHASFIDFMKLNVGVPYGKLLRILRNHRGTMVPMMQMTTLHIIDGLSVCSARELARDTLLRSLCDHVASGWNCGKQARWKRALAFSEWNLPREQGNWDQINALADRVWKEIESQDPPPEWCPRTLDDPILEVAFSLGWPE
jgi:hypothetical protein